MKKSYLLGIDIGTSACKVAVFDREGRVLAAANGAYPVQYRKLESHRKKSPEWELTDRAGRQSQ